MPANSFPYFTCFFPYCNPGIGAGLEDIVLFCSGKNCYVWVCHVSFGFLLRFDHSDIIAWYFRLGNGLIKAQVDKSLPSGNQFVSPDDYIDMDDIGLLPLPLPLSSNNSNVSTQVTRGGTNVGDNSTVEPLVQAPTTWSKAKGSRFFCCCWNSTAHDFTQRRSQTRAAKLSQRPSLSRHKQPKRQKKGRGDVLCTKPSRAP